MLTITDFHVIVSAPSYASGAVRFSDGKSYGFEAASPTRHPEMISVRLQTMEVWSRKITAPKRGDMIADALRERQAI